MLFTLEAHNAGANNAGGLWQTDGSRAIWGSRTAFSDCRSAPVRRGCWGCAEPRWSRVDCLWTIARANSVILTIREHDGGSNHQVSSWTIATSRLIYGNCEGFSELCDTLQAVCKEATRLLPFLADAALRVQRPLTLSCRETCEGGVQEDFQNDCRRRPQRIEQASVMKTVCMWGSRS